MINNNAWRDSGGPSASVLRGTFATGTNGVNYLPAQAVPWTHTQTSTRCPRPACFVLLCDAVWMATGWPQGCFLHSSSRIGFIVRVSRSVFELRCYCLMNICYLFLTGGKKKPCSHIPSTDRFYYVCISLRKDNLFQMHVWKGAVFLISFLTRLGTEACVQQWNGRCRGRTGSGNVNRNFLLCCLGSMNTCLHKVLRGSTEVSTVGKWDVYNT